MYDTDLITEEALSSSKVQNKLMKFWATFAKQVSVPMDIQQNYWLSLDDLEEKTVFNSGDLVGDLFQKVHVTDEVNFEPQNDLREQYAYVTLSDLLDTGNTEDLYGLRQFSVKPSRVGSIAYDLMDSGCLHIPIELGYTVENGIDQLIIVSGRHRAFALASIFSKLERWGDLEVVVKIIRFNTQTELANYIQAANGSRAMSTVEQTMIWFNQHNLDATNEDTLFDLCPQGLAMFNKACGQLFALQLNGLDLQPTTLGRIGTSFAGKFRNKLDKNVRVFLKDPAIASEIANTAVSTFESNLEAFRQMVKVEHKDTEGNTVNSYNFARKYNIVGDQLASAIAKEYEQQFSDKLIAKQSELDAKKKTSAAKAVTRKKDSINETLELLRKHGVDVGEVDIDELIA